MSFGATTFAQFKIKIECLGKQIFSAPDFIPIINHVFYKYQFTCLHNYK